MKNQKFHTIQGAPSTPFSDGFGGVAEMFLSSPSETVPFVAPGLPNAPAGAVKPMAYGNVGTGDESQGGKTVHGMHECGMAGCGFAAKTSHGLARHVYATHGGFGGLGRHIGRK